MHLPSNHQVWKQDLPSTKLGHLISSALYCCFFFPAVCNNTNSSKMNVCRCYLSQMWHKQKLNENLCYSCLPARTAMPSQQRATSLERIIYSTLSLCSFVGNICRSRRFMHLCITHNSLFIIFIYFGLSSLFWDADKWATQLPPAGGWKVERNYNNNKKLFRFALTCVILYFWCATCQKCNEKIFVIVWAV